MTAVTELSKYVYILIKRDFLRFLVFFICYTIDLQIHIVSRANKKCNKHYKL